MVVLMDSMDFRKESWWAPYNGSSTESGPFDVPIFLNIQPPICTVLYESCGRHHHHHLHASPCTVYIRNPQSQIQSHDHSSSFLPWFLLPSHTPHSIPYPSSIRLSMHRLYKKSKIPNSKLRSFIFLPSMVSSSLACPTFHSIPIRSLHQHQRSTPMAACIDNSRADAAKTSLYCDSNRSQIDNSRCKYVDFICPDYANFVTCDPIKELHESAIDLQSSPFSAEEEEEDLWVKICEEAQSDIQKEPILQSYYLSTVLSYNSLESALANHLANKLGTPSLPSYVLFELFSTVMIEDREIGRAVRDDLKAAKERDPACISYVHCLLNFKGFLACQSHRVAHKLWSCGRKVLALLIQNRVSEVFAVDIHPGAKIGRGILFDHATGVVIGETAVIGDNVSILHNVTLGGTGKESGDRHPKIGNGVLLGAGTNVLGNVSVGEGAKIGAGSVVLKKIPPRTTAVGNPARLLGGKDNPVKLDKLPSFTMDQTSHIHEWSDYVI